MFNPIYNSQDSGICALQDIIAGTQLSLYFSSNPLPIPGCPIASNNFYVHDCKGE